MNRLWVWIVILAITGMFVEQTQAQEVCQETNLSFLTEVYVGTPTENAARIRLFTENGYGSAAMVDIDGDVFLMTAGHVAWQATLEEMSVFIPGCGVLLEIINPDEYIVYKRAYDQIMLYSLSTEIVDALHGIVEPLTISEIPVQNGNTIYFPAEETVDLLPYYVVSETDVEVYAVMWNEDNEVCVSMSGSPALDGEGNVAGILSSAPTIAESNSFDDCFLQVYVTPVVTTSALYLEISGAGANSPNDVDIETDNYIIDTESTYPPELRRVE